jgi:ABC-type sugar transport system substrate-binding protein
MATADAAVYDGGQPAHAPDRAGQAITIADVPKVAGIGYFDATERGMREAADELGNVRLVSEGPEEATVDEQTAVIEQHIDQGVDGILVAANDPLGLAPELQRAMNAGIHVVGYDANPDPAAREWFVNQAPANAVAKALIDEMAAEKGPNAQIAILTSTLTTPNQARWIAEMSAYAANCFPAMTWLTTVEAQEDSVLSFNQASMLLSQYGDALDGLFAMTSIATPAAAEAVTQTGRCGAVAVIGLELPNAMRPFMETGCVKSVVFWNPVDLGYAAVYVMRRAIDGDLRPGATSVDAGRLGRLAVNGSEVLLGPPILITSANIDEYDF